MRFAALVFFSLWLGLEFGMDAVREIAQGISVPLIAAVMLCMFQDIREIIRSDKP